MVSSPVVPPAFAIGTAGAPLSLRSYLSPTGMSMPLFLTLAVGIVKAVLPLHSAFHVHAAIKPDHILVDPVTQDITLIGQRPRTSELSLDLGLFPYMAPEQTGMMRRVIDHRSDIYGLGILFYEMLFGRLPFRAQEPIEWVHAHVAAPPDGRDASQVPEALWAIVAKCLEKLPEYRYQSTYGLLQDLLRVRDASGGMALSAFRPGEQDVPNALRVSRKVYGRHADARALADLYEGLKADEAGLVLVTGEPGVGKSTLVRHVLDEHLTRGSLVGTGGCEAGQEATPFAPVAALLRSLVRKRLTEPDAVVMGWLDQVKEIVSMCPELLVLVPELELPLGHPQVPEMDPQAVISEQVPGAVKALMRLCLGQSDGRGDGPEEGRPAVFWLDDLQWSDLQSRMLLRDLVRDATLRPALWILSARPEGEAWLLALEDDGVRDSGSNRVRTAHLKPQPLTSSDIAAMLADTVRLDQAVVQPLAELVQGQTLGNPFHIRRLLIALVQDRHIRFDGDRGVWVIDYEAIAQLPVSDGVMAVLAHQLEELPPDTRTLLEYASCQGRLLHLPVLSAVVKVPLHPQAPIVAPALVQGWLVYVNSDEGGLHFVHDQAQQVLYESIAAERRKQMHDEIAKALIALPGESDASVYMIANQLNKGAGLPENSEHIARYNLEAGEKARAAGAFAAARGYFESGYAVWQGRAPLHDPILWQLCLGRTHCAYAERAFEKAEVYVAELIERAQSDEEIAAAYVVKMTWLAHFNQHVGVVDVGYEALSRLGMRIPRKVSVAQLIVVIGRVIVRWRGRAVDAIERLPFMTSGRTLQQIIVMQSMGAAAYREQPLLQMYTSLRMLELTLARGNHRFAGTSLSAFAMMVTCGFHRPILGRAFGQFAMRHADQYQLPTQQTSTHFTFATFVNPWVAPLATSLGYLEIARKHAVRAGNLVMQEAANGFTVVVEWLVAVPLPVLAAHLDEYGSSSELSRDELMSTLIRSVARALVALTDTASPLSIPDPPDDFDVYGRYYTSVLLMYAHAVLGDFVSVRRLLKVADTAGSQAFWDLCTGDRLFFKGLVAGLDLEADDDDGSGRRARIGEVTRCQKTLIQFARHAPDNHAHKVGFLEAIRMRAHGDRGTAVHALLEAADGAWGRGLWHFAGIAYEWAARWCETDGQHSLGVHALSQAVASYQAWGAARRVSELRARMGAGGAGPWAAGEVAAGNGPGAMMAGGGGVAGMAGMLTTSRDAFARDLDMQAIVEVARSFSEEMVRERLFRKILRAMVLHSGAQRAVLLLQREQTLYVEADGRETDESIQLFQGQCPLSIYRELPHSVVLYVQRTQQHVLLGHAGRDPRFADDLYIERSGAMSVICLPILRQRQLIGLVYLEHAAIPELFTDSQVQMISIIGAQAAISIQNADMYNTLEALVSERTRELEASNGTLQETNAKLQHSEMLRRQMISDISHDLRTPLTSIQGYLEAVLEGVVTQADLPKYLGIARDKTLQINRLIQDLFDLSTFDEKYGFLQKEMVSLLDLAHSIGRKYEFDVRRAGLQFHLELDEMLQTLDGMDLDDFLPESEVFVHIDVRRVDQVFGNLIGNAIRHTHPGGHISLQVKLCSNRTTYYTEAGQTPTHALLSVRDTGTGIKEDDLPYVFERFYKADRSRTKDTSGSGLGLAISRAIIEGHDGAIWVESKAGKGTTFFVLLPVAALIGAGGGGEA